MTVIVCICTTGAFAADREIEIDGKYLNFPVKDMPETKDGAAKCVVSVQIEGEKVREFVIDLAPGEPDYWVYLEVEDFIGKTASLNAEGIAENQIKAFESVYSAETFGLIVCAFPDGKEQTRIEYNPSKGELTVDLEKSSLDESIKHYYYNMFWRDGEENPVVSKQIAPFKLQFGEKLELRVFIDRSIIEIFANGRKCVTQRIYPTRDDSTGIELFSKGGSMTVNSLKAWDIAPTNQW